MSKASEFVQSDFAMSHPRQGSAQALRFGFPDGPDAQVGWVIVDPEAPRVPMLTFVAYKRIELLPSEAIEFARWILDTFEDQKKAWWKP